MLADVPPAGCAPDAYKLFVGNVPKSYTEEASCRSVVESLVRPAPASPSRPRPTGPRPTAPRPAPPRPAAGLPLTLFFQELLPLFASVGHVVELVVVRDKATHDSKGSAFAWYRNKADADRATLALHLRHTLRDPLGEPERPLVVRRAHTRRAAAAAAAAPPPPPQVPVPYRFASAPHAGHAASRGRAGGPPAPPPPPPPPPHASLSFPGAFAGLRPPPAVLDSGGCSSGGSAERLAFGGAALGSPRLSAAPGPELRLQPVMLQPALPLQAAAPQPVYYHPVTPAGLGGGWASVAGVARLSDAGDASSGGPMLRVLLPAGTQPHSGNSCYVTSYTTAADSGAGAAALSSSLMFSGGFSGGGAPPGSAGPLYALQGSRSSGGSGGGSGGAVAAPPLLPSAAAAAPLGLAASVSYGVGEPLAGPPPEEAEEMTLQIPLMSGQMAAISNHVYSVQLMSGAAVTSQAVGPGVWVLLLRGGPLQVETANQLIATLLQAAPQ
jgi:hypothetical protein